MPGKESLGVSKVNSLFPTCPEKGNKVTLLSTTQCKGGGVTHEDLCNLTVILRGFFLLS